VTALRNIFQDKGFAWLGELIVGERLPAGFFAADCDEVLSG
jgi:hypothetical protein